MVWGRMDHLWSVSEKVGLAKTSEAREALYEQYMARSFMRSAESLMALEGIP